jgi:hypothetical protein
MCVRMQRLACCTTTVIHMLHGFKAAMAGGRSTVLITLLTEWYMVADIHDRSNDLGGA